MNKVYNTQKKIANDLANFFKKVHPTITKPHLKLIPYIITAMIEAESVVTTDIVKKLKDDFCLVNPFSTVRRLERFFNNPKFDVYSLYNSIISETILKYKPKEKEIYVTLDHMYCGDKFTILLFSLKIDKQRNPFMV